ncbi:MAG: NYN domain-containing protein [Elusimicrobia bacterium]|nr:NYN domain-containing protein [Elusimicrobiota bacterium]
MRTYLVDGSNAVRRHDYDPRFPAVEERRTLTWLSRLDRLSGGALGKFQVEVFFDGRARDVGGPYAGLRIRFSAEARADDMILGVVRLLGFSGRGAVVVTEDGALADEARSEGARVLRFSEFEDRLRSRKA